MRERKRGVEIQCWIKGGYVIVAITIEGLGKCLKDFPSNFANHPPSYELINETPLIHTSKIVLHLC